MAAEGLLVDNYKIFLANDGSPDDNRNLAIELTRGDPPEHDRRSFPQHRSSQGENDGTVARLRHVKRRWSALVLAPSDLEASVVDATADCKLQSGRRRADRECCHSRLRRSTLTLRELYDQLSITMRQIAPTVEIIFVEDRGGRSGSIITELAYVTDVLRPRGVEVVALARGTGPAIDCKADLADPQTFVDPMRLE